MMEQREMNQKEYDDVELKSIISTQYFFFEMIIDSIKLIVYELQEVKWADE